MQRQAVVLFSVKHSSITFQLHSLVSKATEVFNHRRRWERTQSFEKSLEILRDLIRHLHTNLVSGGRLSSCKTKFFTRKPLFEKIQLLFKICKLSSNQRNVGESLVGKKSCYRLSDQADVIKKLGPKMRPTSAVTRSTKTSLFLTS